MLDESVPAHARQPALAAQPSWLQSVERELRVASATRSTLARSATVHARPLGLHADSGHGGRALILCAAGDIHGALDRLFEDVLAFEESVGAAWRARGGRRAAGELAAMGSCDSARAAVVHGHRAVAERLRREQLEPARAGQPALVQRRAVAGDPGMDEQLVLVDQVQPVELGRELAASEEDPGRGRVLELLHALA